MTKEELLERMRQPPWAVLASVSETGMPQAAVIGVVVTDDLEIFFDTLQTSRKCENLRRDPKIALVIGWDEGWTVQYEGSVDEPRGADLVRLKQLYFVRYPDGRARELDPDIAYFRARPTWIRHSDFRGPQPAITELVAHDL